MPDIDKSTAGEKQQSEVARSAEPERTEVAIASAGDMRRAQLESRRARIWGDS